jgi:glutathione S-transferase
VCRVADAAVKDAAAVEANNVLLVGLLDDAEAQLAKSAYLAGPAYSVADVMFTPVLFRCAVIIIIIITSFVSNA